MDGHFKEPQATAAVIQNDWLYTGDMAYRMTRATSISSIAKKISSSAAPKTSLAHPAVLECAVVAAPDHKWGAIPAAIVVLKPTEKLSKAELLAFLEKTTAKFKLPRLVQFETEPLPKTGTSKILKRELREAFWHAKERHVQGG